MSWQPELDELEKRKVLARKMGGDVRGSTPEEMRARVASELQNWSRVISEARIERE